MLAARKECVHEHTQTHTHMHTRCWTPGGTSGVAVHSSFPSRPLGTNAYMNTHTRTRTCTHDARRQVAPLVLLSIHPSCALSTCVHAHACTLGTNACMNTRTRTRTCTHDAGRQVAPLVLLSIHPSYHRTDARNDCVPEHTHAHTHIHTRCWTPGGTSGVAVHSSFLPSH